MAYERDYEQVSAIEAGPALQDDVQRLHGYVSAHDEMLDMLMSKLEHMLLPSNPSPGKGDTPSEKPSSAFRDEIRHIGRRMDGLNQRLRGVLNRLDI